ncbi:MAG: hypothetical protein JNL67_12560 [Planctomycetaceae bacterium]|nr:hypothetical protein [Planctomycetaceae bacterium]
MTQLSIHLNDLLLFLSVCNPHAKHCSTPIRLMPAAQTDVVSKLFVAPAANPEKSLLDGHCSIVTA